MPAPPDTVPPLPAGLPLATAAALQDDLLTATHDLDRLQRLLGNACGTLMRNFVAVHAMLDELPALPDRDAAALRAEISGAIGALQFEDMAAQLIAHTALRLRACADRIAREALGDDEDEPAAGIAPPARPNPVTQDEMDAGSIELF